MHPHTPASYLGRNCFNGPLPAQCRSPPHCCGGRRRGAKGPRPPRRSARPGCSTDAFRGAIRTPAHAPRTRWPSLSAPLLASSLGRGAQTGAEAGPHVVHVLTVRHNVSEGPVPFQVEVDRDLADANGHGDLTDGTEASINLTSPHLTSPPLLAPPISPPVSPTIPLQFGASSTAHSTPCKIYSQPRQMPQLQVEAPAPPLR